MPQLYLDRKAPAGRQWGVRGHRLSGPNAGSLKVYANGLPSQKRANSIRHEVLRILQLAGGTPRHRKRGLAGKSRRRA